MKGLYQKYLIEKSDGTAVDPSAKYFVLRIDTDLHARVAFQAYSDSIAHSNPKLAAQITEMLKEIPLPVFTEEKQVQF